MTTDSTTREQIRCPGYVLGVVGISLPLVFLSIPLVLTAASGEVLFWIPAAVLNLAAARGFYLCSRGGLSRDREDIEIRGGLRTFSLSVREVDRVEFYRNVHGQPIAHLVTKSGRRAVLRGTFTRHRHSIRSPTHCPMCDENMSAISRAASVIGVPLLEIPNSRAR